MGCYKKLLEKSMIIYIDSNVDVILN